METPPEKTPDDGSGDELIWDKCTHPRTKTWVWNRAHDEFLRELRGSGSVYVVEATIHQGAAYRLIAVGFADLPTAREYIAWCFDHHLEHHQTSRIDVTLCGADEYAEDAD